MKDLSYEQQYKAMRYWWLCYIAYCLTMISAKISIGIFLLRVAVNKIHRTIILTVMGLSVLTGCVFFFVTLFQCSPISFFWDRQLPGGKCVNVYVIIGLTYLYSAVSAICDFTFGILPIFMVWNLNMARDAKLMLIPILSMACV
jgi:membrane-anchored glycerophosphoryl diester phosphodiesterase (GDPDase)